MIFRIFLSPLVLKHKKLRFIFVNYFRVHYRKEYDCTELQVVSNHVITQATEEA